jgi:ABC-type multidrug transport system fused ATPase/permease subunit
VPPGKMALTSKARASRLWRLWPRPFIEEPVEISETDSKTSSVPWYSICLFVLSLTGFTTQIIFSLNTTISWTRVTAALWAAAALHIAIWRPRTGSVILFVDYMGIVTAGALVMAVYLHRDLHSQNAVLSLTSTGVALIATGIVVNMPLRDPSLSRAAISRPFATPTAELRSPEDNMTLFQWMTVSWLAPLIKIGNKRQLHDDDVWRLAYEFQHRQLHDTFRELKGSVVRRLLVANWIDLALLSILAIIELVANYAAPLLLQKLLQSMEDLNFEQRPAIMWGLLILLLRLIAAQSAVFSLWFGRRCYERSRGELITMLYEKTLNRKILGGLPQTAAESNTVEGGQPSPEDQAPRDTEALPETEQPLLNGASHIKQPTTLAGRARSTINQARLYFARKKTATEIEQKLPASMGKILNLFRNDAYEVAQRFWEFQNLINKPLGLVFSFVLIWKLMGWASLVSVAVVLVAQVLNYILARILISFEKERRKATDVKLQKITQYIEAIRHLRWYGWHFTWLEGVMDSRQKELNLRIVTFLLNMVIKTLNSFTSGVLPVATFYAYTVLAGHQLRVDIAFPAMQLFALLQTNIRELPNLITVLLNANVAVSRISDFIAEPDKIDEAEFPTASEDRDRLELQKASFSWPGLPDTVLRDISLTFPRGLTVVFGEVAAGKTALLQALLGELDLHSGHLYRPQAAMGYCAQSPWIQSMNIRENILFNSPYEEDRYKKTLEACALLPDLANFKHGDLSEIGENGIGLSGGQKARVALARAVYSRTQILLLDDPLSALDHQTAEWLVTKCFCGGLMEDRVVILVTHRTDLCQHLATQLVEISNGTAILHRNDEDLSKVLSASSDTAVDTKHAEDRQRVDEAAAIPEKFVEEEYRAHGGVQLRVYWEYIKAGTVRWWLMVVLTAAACRAVYFSETWFLKEWGEAYNRAKAQLFLFQLSDSDFHLLQSPISGLFDSFPNPNTDVKPWLLGFFVIVAAETVGLLLSQVSMLVVTYTAARRMFQVIMARISNATFRFYDVTPVGRLMNRLTSDIGTIDGGIADKFLIVIWYGVAWIASMIVIGSVTPLFLLFAAILTIAFVTIFLQFLPTSQSLRRLEMVSLTPLMSNFGALLHGLMTVRAFNAQAQFQEKNIQVTDAFQKMDHFYWSLQTWIMYRFDTLSAVSTFLMTLLAIYSNLSAGLTAFVLTAANKFVQSTHVLCKGYGELQLNFVSVERVVELVHVEQESSSSIDPPAGWPKYGSEVVFENVTMRYQARLDPALIDVSVRFKGGSTNAITGRTGSGKSTMALALLATVLPEKGRILIDGIDIARVNKQALRSRITFLAQEPILFPGTLRHNLDPLQEHSDTACESVLARVCGNYGWTLETQIDSEGKNLSQGQRQLVGLARAILRRSAIIIMDEATASIDLDTSAEIQRVLREELRESTIITIAHRAAAVANAEFCVSLAAGRVSYQGPSQDATL